MLAALWGTGMPSNQSLDKYSLLAGVWALMLFAIVISQGSGNAFIYFQF
jgi:hypothetical protein